MSSSTVSQPVRRHTTSNPFEFGFPVQPYNTNWILYSGNSLNKTGFSTQHYILNAPQTKTMQQSIWESAVFRERLIAACQAANAAACDGDGGGTKVDSKTALVQPAVKSVQQGVHHVVKSVQPTDKPKIASRTSSPERHCSAVHSDDESTTDSMESHSQTAEEDHTPIITSFVKRCIGCQAPTDKDVCTKCPELGNKWFGDICLRHNCTGKSDCRFGHPGQTLVCTYCRTIGHTKRFCAHEYIHCQLCGEYGHWTPETNKQRSGLMYICRRLNQYQRVRDVKTHAWIWTKK
jgi:hypothetical protein